MTKALSDELADQNRGGVEHFFFHQRVVLHPFAEVGDLEPVLRQRDIDHPVERLHDLAVLLEHPGELGPKPVGPLHDGRGVSGHVSVDQHVNSPSGGSASCSSFSKWA